MLRVSTHLQRNCDSDASLTLPFSQRQKSRLRGTLDDGREVGLFLPRGGTLRGGDRLEAEDGSVIEIRSAPERVSRVTATGGRDLTRAAYHLGNRHVALEIGEGWLQYLHDHVLDDMLLGLGFEVEVSMAPFEPEPGAYWSGRPHHHHHGGEEDHDPLAADDPPDG